MLKQLAMKGINVIMPTPVMEMPYMDRKPVWKMPVMNTL